MGKWQKGNGREDEAHSEGEAGAGGLDGEHCSAQVAVVLEVVHQGLPRARLHAPVNAHVLCLRPAPRCLIRQPADKHQTMQILNDDVLVFTLTLEIMYLAFVLQDSAQVRCL